MTVFVDNNVVLDVLLERDGEEASTQIMKKCETGVITGFISTNCMYICAYLLYRKFRNLDKTKEMVLNLLRIFKVAISPKEVFKDACLSQFTDLEDAFQYYSALLIPGIAYIITRNTKDFKESTIPVLTPEDFLNLYFNV